MTKRSAKIVNDKTALITCSACGKQQACKPRVDGSAKISPPWKRMKEGILCGDCKRKRYTICAVAFPVHKPIGASWDEFGKAVRKVWMDATQLANWGLTELFRREPPRKPNTVEVPKQAKINLYNIGFTNKGYWNSATWKLCTQSACSILKCVESYYARRRNAIWDGKESLRSMRYPQPYPINGTGWEAYWVTEGTNKYPAVRFNLDGREWDIRLKSGHEFRRQLKRFSMIVDGAEQCEMAIYRKKKAMMVKLVAFFPKAEGPKSGHTLLVRTDPNALWVCERVEDLGGFDATSGKVVEHRTKFVEWILNGDETRRWVAAHRAFLQRTRQDTKWERRCQKYDNPNLARAREVRCRKYQDRIDSKTHEYTALVVKFAQRNGAAIVVYDDTDQSFLGNFPWYSLREKLKWKLESAGITFVHQGGDSQADDEDRPQGDEECQLSQVSSTELRQALEVVQVVERLAKTRSRGVSESHPAVSVPPAISNGSAARQRRTS